MFKKILKYMWSNGEFNTGIISKALNINQALVEQVKIDLINKGYIQKEEGLCDTDKCKSCSCGCSGNLLNEVSSYKFTEKAMKIFRK